MTIVVASKGDGFHPHSLLLHRNFPANFLNFDRGSGMTMVAFVTRPPLAGRRPFGTAADDGRNGQESLPGHRLDVQPEPLGHFSRNF